MLARAHQFLHFYKPGKRGKSQQIEKRGIELF